MQRVYTGKPRYDIFPYKGPADTIRKIVFIHMQDDESAHDKKKIHHQITFLKKHRRFRRYKPGNRHFKMKNSNQQCSNPSKWCKI